MSSDLCVAAIQFAPRLGQTEQNIENIEMWTHKAAKARADIVVFPECALQGIVFSSATEALEHAEELGGPALTHVAALARDHDVAIILGFLERLPYEGGLANAAGVFFPDGSSSVYRKTHLTELGADRWVEAGSCLSDVHSFRGMRFGVLICYDVRFPEATRILALRGADAVILPTNSPLRYEAAYDHGARTRAWENRIWFVVANRIGTERDTTFIGRSLIADPHGQIVSWAKGDEETMIIGDLDVETARSKLLPGHDDAQFDFWDARRPELYDPLVERSVDITDLAVGAQN
jgi:5-aminopentanamidase